MTSEQTKLIFVYNADSGFFNTATDIAHKIISPQTYSCNLCNLTHGYFKIRTSWVKFLQQLDVECEFLHRDELDKHYNFQNHDLPAIYIMKNNVAELWITKQEIEQFKNIDDFISHIRNKLG
ncbi:MAG: hypothetical protein OEZ38_12025 [Gammaproteobacteria bacterium]|nr:hypothetical protein [Gammaproteobacteria bacterium]